MSHIKTKEKTFRVKDKWHKKIDEESIKTISTIAFEFYYAIVPIAELIMPKHCHENIQCFNMVEMPAFLRSKFDRFGFLNKEDFIVANRIKNGNLCIIDGCIRVANLQNAGIRYVRIVWADILADDAMLLRDFLNNPSYKPGSAIRLFHNCIPGVCWVRTDN